MTDNFKGMLGLCRRAGKLVPGYDTIVRLKKKPVLLVCACDMSARTAKNIDALGLKTVRTDLTKQELGSVLGLHDVAVAGITDPSFAAAIESKQGVCVYGSNKVQDK